MRTNPAKLYWAIGITIEPDGQIRTSGDQVPEARERMIDHFREFFQPWHVYLDVTAASKKDVEALWGERKTKTDAKNAIPKQGTWLAQHILLKLEGHDLQVPLDQLKTMHHIESRIFAMGLLKAFEVPAPRNKVMYTERELVNHICRTLKKRLRSNPAPRFVPMPNWPTSVSECQDALLVADQIPATNRAGRAKGEQRSPRPWLGASMFRDVENELKAHPADYDRLRIQFQQQAIEKERDKKSFAGKQNLSSPNFNHKFVSWQNPLTPMEERRIRGRAGKTFDKRLGHLKSHK